MGGWKNVRLGSIATLNYGKSLPAEKRVRGPVPVYGSNGIVGYHDVATVPSEGIVIGRKGTAGAVRFSAVPFCPIDTTYYIAPDDATVDLRFLAYLLQHARLSRLVSDLVPGLNRDAAYAHVVQVPESLEEQRQIARLLSAVLKSIEWQGRLVDLTAELKTTLMQKLVTEGTRSEVPRQTEIGPIPDSWSLVPLGSLFSRQPSNGMYRPQSDYGRGVMVLRIEDFSNEGDTVTRALHRVEATADEVRRFGLSTDDIVLNRVNSLSHLGKTALVGDLREPMVFESNMMRFRVDETRILPRFAFRILNSAVGKSQLVSAAKRAVAQSSVNQGDVARVLLPLPPNVAEQAAIVEAIDTVEGKQAVHRRTGQSLDDLFRTLLEQLMTGQLDVHELDLPEFEESSAAPILVA